MVIASHTILSGAFMCISGIHSASIFRFGTDVFEICITALHGVVYRIDRQALACPLDVASFFLDIGGYEMFQRRNETTHVKVETTINIYCIFSHPR